MTNEQGAVFDLRYKPHEGERLGRRGAIMATMRDGIRRILGLRRRARKKIMPWTLFGFSLLPVIAFVALAFFTNTLAEGVDTDSLFAGHPSIFTFNANFFFIFTALAAPELLIPDRVEGVLSVYASRPMRITDYLGARIGALAVAAGGFLVLPQLLLYVGLASLEEEGLFTGLTSNAADLPKILLAAVLYLMAYGAPAFLVSMYAKRLGPAWVVYGAVMLFSTGFAVAITETTGGAGRYAALAALPVNADIAMDWIFGQTTFREGISGAGLGPVWSVATILVVAAVAWIVGLRRYRSLL